MIPSARTPTTSNRWTTALRRKRRGRLMIAKKPIRVAPKEAEQPEQGMAGLGDPAPKLADRAAGHLVGDDAGRAVGLRHLIEQATDLGAFADDSGMAITHRAIDQPSADGVHPGHSGQVDRHSVAHRRNLALGGRGARDRQRADAGVIKVGVIIAFTVSLTGHRQRDCAKSIGAARGRRRRGAILRFLAALCVL